VVAWDESANCSDVQQCVECAKDAAQSKEPLVTTSPLHPSTTRGRSRGSGPPLFADIIESHGDYNYCTSHSVVRHAEFLKALGMRRCGMEGVEGWRGEGGGGQGEEVVG
jgi:hypothetical protein